MKEFGVKPSTDSLGTLALGGASLILKFNISSLTSSNETTSLSTIINDESNWKIMKDNYKKLLSQN